MSTAYRLIKKKRAAQAFSGDGARLYGGRWNSKGNPCIYLASTPSLALLEVMVHLEYYDLLASYLLFKIELLDSSLLELDNSLLPIDWQDDPPPVSTAQIGDNWLAEQSSLGLYVPSAIMPIENNILLNSEYPSFSESLTTVKKINFEPDTRL